MHVKWTGMPGMHINIIIGLCLGISNMYICSLMTLPEDSHKREEHQGLKGTLTFIFYNDPGTTGLDVKTRQMLMINFMNAGPSFRACEDFIIGILIPQTLFPK